MDLQEFNDDMLYFQKPIDERVKTLVNEAARNYGPESEHLLLQALALEETDLTVLIGLYRFYYYQNRYADGLTVALKVMSVVADDIKFPSHWQQLQMAHIATGASYSICLVRLYLFALKAAGYLQLRMGNYEAGRNMIEKVVALDSKDRIGGRLLLNILDANKADVISFVQQQRVETV